jgi:hypothetical protein
VQGQPNVQQLTLDLNELDGVLEIGRRAREINFC